jgi:uncharacterized protein (TIGR02246 family)
MRTAVLRAATAAMVVSASIMALAQKPQPSPPKPAPKSDSKPPAKGPAPSKPAGTASAQGDERVIRRAAEAFAKAYNAHDTKAVAELFAADAEIVNELGESTQGRGEIQKVFAGIFDENPETQISVDIKSIRFLTPAVAVEEGTSSVTHAPDQPPENTRYVVVHARQDGKWLMASARDLAEEQEDEDPMALLEWMIGDWVDDGPDSLVVTSARWSDNHRYILGDFTIEVSGRTATFDSEGGFSEGVYSQDGDQWIVKMRGVTHDGKLASSTNVTTLKGKDRRTWESHDRVVGGEVQPDIEEVSIVRKPPKRK